MELNLDRRMVRNRRRQVESCVQPIGNMEKDGQKLSLGYILAQYSEKKSRKFSGSTFFSKIADFSKKCFSNCKSKIIHIFLINF